MFCRLINRIFVGAVPLNSTRHHVNWNNEGLEQMPTSVYPYSLAYRVHWPILSDVRTDILPCLIHPSANTSTLNTAHSTCYQINLLFPTSYSSLLPSLVCKLYFWNGHVWISKLIPPEIQLHLCHLYQIPMQQMLATVTSGGGDKKSKSQGPKHPV